MKTRISMSCAAATMVALVSLAPQLAFAHDKA